MAEEASLKFRLRTIDATRNYLLEKIKHNGLMSKKYKKTYKYLNYVETCVFWVCLITCLTCSRANMPCMVTCSHTNVPFLLTCSRANVSCMLTCWHANVPCVVTCSRANVPCMFTCWHGSVSCMLMYSLVNVPCVPKCSSARTSNNKNKFSVAYFT